MFVLYLKRENMKTINSISKVTMLLAFVAFTNTLMATGNLVLNIVPLNSDRAVVAISNNEAANFKISIENNRGEKIYYSETRPGTSGYQKVYDFSQLEDGNYTMTVSDNSNKIERNFTINEHKIVVSKEKTLGKPFFAYKDGILKVSYLNFQEENLSLDMYKDDNLVYTKELGKNFNVIEGFDLSKVEKGNYRVKLAGNDNVFTYNISVE